VALSQVLLDTSAYSAFKRGNPEVLALLQEADEIHVNAVVLGELGAGFRGGTRRRENEQELTAFLASPRVRLAPMGEETADRYASIHAYLKKAGTPIPTNDLWIAATAMEHGLRVITTDGDFDRVVQIAVTRVATDGPRRR
jgi:predicted nucleic acid-binding protein